jgi:hypothetical protein
VAVLRVGDRKRAAGRYIAAAVVEVEGGSSARVGLRSAGEGRTALAAVEEQNAAVLVLVLVAGLEVDMWASREEEGSSSPVVEGFLARNLTCWSSVLENLLPTYYIYPKNHGSKI